MIFIDSQSEHRIPTKNIPETMSAIPTESAPTQPIPKTTVDDDGYFDVVIRP